MSDNANLAQQMRDRLNKLAGKKVTLETSKTEELVQVEGWVEMGEYFRRATGGKGYPEGHVTQIIGKSDTGKTTLMIIGMIETQKSGGIVYLIDSEHKFPFERFTLMGGNVKDLIVIPVDSLEDAWSAWSMVNTDIAEFRKKDTTTKVTVAWDSVAASVPDAILDSDAEDKHVSVDAKINNTEIRKLRKRIKMNKITAIFINHSYWTMPKFGIAEEVIKGGAEMFFMSTLILKTKRRAWLKRTINKVDERFGVHSLLEVFKGHLGGAKATVPMYVVGQGILGSEKELADYKDLIEDIEGPDINLLTMDQLKEIRAKRPVKEKKKSEEPKPTGKKGKKSKPAQANDEEASEEDESEAE
jgi:RecA/RadA recombinase